MPTLTLRETLTLTGNATAGTHELGATTPAIGDDIDFHKTELSGKKKKTATKMMTRIRIREKGISCPQSVGQDV